MCIKPRRRHSELPFLLTLLILSVTTARAVYGQGEVAKLAASEPNTIASEQIESTRSVQRVFQISDAGDLTGALLSQDINSALDILSKPIQIDSSSSSSGESLNVGAMSVSQLAQTMTRDVPFESSMSATAEILARSGIDIVDGESLHAKGHAPRAPFPVTTVELAKMTIEQRNREQSYSFTLDELAEMLAALGWPFQAVSSPGHQLQAFFLDWIRAAHQVPNDTHSAAPLFVEAGLQMQRPAIDLADQSRDPSEFRLTLLEVELFVGALERFRGMEDANATVSKEHPARSLTDTALLLPAADFRRSANDALLASLSPYLVAATGSAAAIEPTDPCGSLRSMAYGMFGLEGSVGGEVVDYILGLGSEAAMKAALRKQNLSRKQVEMVFGAAGVLAQIWKLIGLYQGLPIVVTVDPPLVHKPRDVPPGAIAMFRAEIRTPGPPPGQQGPISKVAAGCLAAAGLPDLRDVSEQIADNIASYSVEWHLEEGSPEHAVDARVKDQPHAVPIKRVSDVYHQGRVRTGLDRGANGVFSSRFRVDMNKEESKKHPSFKTKAPVVACAEVDTTSRPTVSTIVGAATGPSGLATSIAELVSGWIQKGIKPKACEALEVEYCDKYVLVLTRTDSPLQICEGMCVTIPGRSTSTEMQMDLAEDGSFTAEGMLDRPFAAEVGPAGGVSGTAKGTAQQRYRFTGRVTDDGDAVRLKLEMPGPVSGSIGATVRTPTGVASTSVEDAGEGSGNGGSCRSDLCAGFDLPLEAGASKAFPFEISYGGYTVKVSYEAELRAQ